MASFWLGCDNEKQQIFTARKIWEQGSGEYALDEFGHFCEYCRQCSPVGLESIGPGLGMAMIHAFTSAFGEEKVKQHGLDLICICKAYMACSAGRRGYLDAMPWQTVRCRCLRIMRWDADVWSPLLKVACLEMGCLAMKCLCFRRAGIARYSIATGPKPGSTRRTWYGVSMEVDGTQVIWEAVSSTEHAKGAEIFASRGRPGYHIVGEIYINVWCDESTDSPIRGTEALCSSGNGLASRSRLRKCPGRSPSSTLSRSWLRYVQSRHRLPHRETSECGPVVKSEVAEAKVHDCCGFEISAANFHCSDIEMWIVI